MKVGTDRVLNLSYSPFVSFSCPTKMGTTNVPFTLFCNNANSYQCKCQSDLLCVFVLNDY